MPSMGGSTTICLKYNFSTFQRNHLKIELFLTLMKILLMFSVFGILALYLFSINTGAEKFIGFFIEFRIYVYAINVVESLHDQIQEAGVDMISLAA